MTVKDLARLSGYSLGTVSRVLNNQPNVSEQARRKIMSIVEESGFELNANAKNLKQQRSTSLLVIVKGRANELFAMLVEQIQSLIRETEHPLLLAYIDEEDNEVRQAAQLCREKKPMGVLFLGGDNTHFLEDFKEINVPAVLVTNSAAGLPFQNLASVTTDDTDAARCAMQFLLDQGHREILVIGGFGSSEVSRMRLDGCVKAVARASCGYQYQPARFSFAQGYEAMDRQLKGGQRVTAVFALADVMAIGAMRCIRDHGLRVPEDISVIGFDGLPLGQYYSPKLSTISQPVEALAKECVELLLDMIDGGKPRHVTVPYTLSVNESVKNIESEASSCAAAAF